MICALKPKILQNIQAFEPCDSVNCPVKKENMFPRFRLPFLFQLILKSTHQAKVLHQLFSGSPESLPSKYLPYLNKKQTGHDLSYRLLSELLRL